MKILIISGFLGAGKTTFIKHLAKNINMEFIVLENEYANIGIDKDFLEEDKLKVWEISEGCICCSMTGDFETSIRNIHRQIDPEYLIVEPTGVGMLSSIIKNIKKIDDFQITILNPITMIDCSSFFEYLKNFKSFFEDNFLNTGKILLTRTEQLSLEEINCIINEIKKINSNLDILSTNYKRLDNNFFSEIFNKNIDNKEIISNFKISEHINLKTFSKLGINFKTMDSLGLFLHKLMSGNFGKIYRAKGVVKIEGQWGKFNIVHKNFEMEPCSEISESKFVIIGNSLKIDKLENELS